MICAMILALGLAGLPVSHAMAAVSPRVSATATASTTAFLPGTSNLNYVKDTTVANLVIPPVDSDGDIDLYNGSSGTAQLTGTGAG